MFESGKRLLGEAQARGEGCVELEGGAGGRQRMWDERGDFFASDR